jgi:hypothetical protein
VKATGDTVCQVTVGDGTLYEFEYYTYTMQAEYFVRRDWVKENIGIFGKDYYHHQGTWWFKTEEDLLAFILRFDYGRNNV